MAFLMNQILGDKLRSFTGGGGEDNSKAGADGEETPEAKGMSREESEEYQRQLVEENSEVEGNNVKKCNPGQDIK
ncbi:complexin-4c [Lates japonicus]|uniref:Complexin-4c n=1 Tax=Lates japonicus TaxID=270547 RepID=A0AAD3MBT2_LATJO|nr:complexin-4c [Lates japonicus]